MTTAGAKLWGFLDTGGRFALELSPEEDQLWGFLTPVVDLLWGLSPEEEKLWSLNPSGSEILGGNPELMNSEYYKIPVSLFSILSKALENIILFITA